MHLFRMKAEQAGMNRMPAFREDNYVSFGWPGIGDLDRISPAELEGKLAEACGPLEPSELQRRAEELRIFAYGMQDGDFLLVDEGERLHLGDVGDYYYADAFDNAEDNGGHRRGVTWLSSLLREELHPELLAFLDREGDVGEFGLPVSQDRMESLLAKPAASASALIDEATIREALDILKAAMRSEDPERRERAAIAILRAAETGWTF